MPSISRILERKPTFDILEFQRPAFAWILLVEAVTLISWQLFLSQQCWLTCFDLCYSPVSLLDIILQNVSVYQHLVHRTDDSGPVFSFHL